MESITNNEFLNSVLESEAWKEVSSRESFSMEMIEKFADKVNWGAIRVFFGQSTAYQNMPIKFIGTTFPTHVPTT